MRRIGALLMVLASAMVTQSAMAAPDSSDCVIDTMLMQNRVVMDQMSAGIYKSGVLDPVKEAIDAAPTVKEAACLPILDTLDSMIRMQIPSVGSVMGGLMTKIRDMACDMANSFLQSIANKASYNVSDPLGIASVGIGATTDGSGGISTSTYDLGKVASDAATRAIGAKVRSAANEAGSAVGDLPAGPTDRSNRAGSGVDKGVRDAINGL